MQTTLDPVEFLAAQAAGRLVLDVRSPGEYAQGHIPGAVSFPLFTDAERAAVGTAYKQKSKEIALELGLEYVGPKMAGFVREARRLAPNRQLAVHCWRGGQRSGSMAWLLRQAGFDVVTLTGGYKNYRRMVLESFADMRCPLVIVGGRTGAGKTKVLRALQSMGEQVLDLERLANHKGSAFGFIGEPPQPTAEQFENDLSHALQQFDRARPIWAENESRSIGRVYIPEDFWAQMKSAPLFNIEVPLEARIQNLLEDYVLTDREDLRTAFLKIEKKLGGQHLKSALEALGQDDFATAARIALHYYDKTYQHGLDTSTSPSIQVIPFEDGDPVKIAEELNTRRLKIQMPTLPSPAPSLPFTPTPGGSHVIAIFASGGGSNARCILEHFKSSEQVSVGLVVSNKADAGVLDIAREYDIPTHLITRKSFYDTEDILPILQDKSVDFIALAGFLWLVPGYLVRAFPRKIVNIHPALLPKFGGKGMYGTHVHEAVKTAGETETGMTIHFVNEHYDEGDIIFQAKCPVSPTDTPADIARNVLRLEHAFFPKIIENLLLKPT